MGQNERFTAKLAHNTLKTELIGHVWERHGFT